MLMFAKARPKLQGGITTPLRVPLFRALWLATLISNFGWLIQNVGAAWLMTSLAGTADMVALVQAATQAPLVCFSLLAGAVADLFDRRRVLIVSQLLMLTASVTLAALTSMGMIGPWSLLACTFALGSGAALQGPAYQAVVRELVSGPDLPAAVMLNGVSFNFARAVGPAIGGMIVALLGAGAAFLANAVSYAGLLVVLVTWRRKTVVDDLPRERMGSAILTGLRYTAENAHIRHILVRVVVFSFAASVALPLLPLVARDMLGGGPLLFGSLLGAFGAGAMVSAFAIHPLRQRFGTERLASGLAILFGAGVLTLALVPWLPLVLLGLAGAGAAWLGCFSFFNISVQTTSAFWVQSRTYAIYQTVMFASMTLGSWLWGELAHHFGLAAAFAVAGVIMLLSPLLAVVAPLPTGRVQDLEPAPHPPEPVPAFSVDPKEGPVLIQVEYRVATSDAPAFVAAMDEVGHIRKRNGGLRWRLFQDVADAEHWVETFVLEDWLAHRRLERRTTAADRAAEALALALHRGDEPPTVRRMIARRRDARFGLDDAEAAALERGK